MKSPNLLSCDIKSEADRQRVIYPEPADRTVQRVNLKNANANGLGGMRNFILIMMPPLIFGQFGYKFQGGTTDSFKQFQVYVADVANPKMVVAGSGNVGIGTFS